MAQQAPTAKKWPTVKCAYLGGCGTDGRGGAAPSEVVKGDIEAARISSELLMVKHQRQQRATVHENTGGGNSTPWLHRCPQTWHCKPEVHVHHWVPRAMSVDTLPTSSTEESADMLSSCASSDFADLSEEEVLEAVMSSRALRDPIDTVVSEAEKELAHSFLQSALQVHGSMMKNVTEAQSGVDLVHVASRPEDDDRHVWALGDLWGTGIPVPTYVSISVLAEDVEINAGLSDALRWIGFEAAKLLGVSLFGYGAASGSLAITWLLGPRQPLRNQPLLPSLVDSKAMARVQHILLMGIAVWTGEALSDRRAQYEKVDASKASEVEHAKASGLVNSQDSVVSRSASPGKIMSSRGASECATAIRKYFDSTLPEEKFSYTAIALAICQNHHTANYDAAYEHVRADEKYQHKFKPKQEQNKRKLSRADSAMSATPRKKQGHISHECFGDEQTK